MKNEPDDDHQGEENVERNRNRNIWNTEVEGDAARSTAPSAGLGDDYHETRHYIDGVSLEHRQ